MADEYPANPVIDVWAILADPDIPRDVGQRLLTRQRAARLGVDPEPVLEADKPFLARHVVEDWRSLEPMAKPQEAL